MNHVADSCSTGRQVLLMVNGPFGGGKSTCARLLRERRPDVLVYDPEAVGALVRSQLPGTTGDYQDFGAWRALVPAAAAALALDYTGPFVMPMSVLRRTYLEEILQRLDEHSFAVRHVVLHTTPQVLLQRITADTGFDADPDGAARIRRWRHRHAADYHAASAWLAGFGPVLDTTHRSPDDVAAALEPLLDAAPHAARRDG